VGFTKREGAWHVSSPINGHKIVTAGKVLR
jgi:hypothetical protein